MIVMNQDNCGTLCSVEWYKEYFSLCGMLQRIKHDIMYHLQHAGVPSSPGRPVIELSTNRIQAQSDENSVTDEINLAWDVPDDDGGYPITGKIERKGPALAIGRRRLFIAVDSFF